MDNLHPALRSLSRRSLLKIGGGFGAIGLAAALQGAGDLQAATSAATSNPLAPKEGHFPGRIKRVIFLFMNGGPSHVDTFDPKPELYRRHGEKLPESFVGKNTRRRDGKLLQSPFSWAQYGEAGTEVSELYPHLAKRIDKICLIRSMWSDNPNHEPGLLLMNTGNMQPIRPSMGSWLTYALGSENQNLPGYIVLCPGKPVVGPYLWSNSFLPGVHQGTQINPKNTDPKAMIRDVNNRWQSPTAQREQLDLLQALNQQHLEQREKDANLEARIASLEMAYRMQGEAQDAFDLGRETAETRARYGTGEFANSCLLARRLSERGVRMVQVYYGNGQPWDDHGDIKNHAKHALASDQPIAALLDDLQARGLWDETLVVWGGEFGRTPMTEGEKGRDHHASGFSMWLAGGGVKGGYVHGATDEFGFQAVEKPMHVYDLHATILHLLGLNHEKLTFRFSGRDIRLTDVHGHVVHDLLT
ncbi:DUF1501 domain-containing protein [Anatilimnocola sp. NA78]|uniref:DUF1501 domain-containing protein n=1 Tax=Anatilimnocola sp. NA78 TaxID=3415683 RepID=UPI003CE57A76